MQKTIKENIMPINTPKIKIKVDTGNLKKALDMTSELKGELGKLRIPVQVIRIGHPEDIVPEKIKTIEDTNKRKAKNTKRTREIKIEIINNLLEQTEIALEKELTKNGQCISPERTWALRVKRINLSNRLKYRNISKKIIARLSKKKEILDLNR